MIIGKSSTMLSKHYFFGASEEEMAVTLDLFWNECTEFDNMIGSFDADEFIWKIKDIRDGNSHLWHQKYSLPCTRVLGFVGCRVTSNVIGIGAAERSWGGVNTIKSHERSTISSDVAEKNSIVYTSSCIESAIIERYHTDKIFNENG